ncbi:hypothetical protein MUK42_32538 [Musa troglodytarum]|uniref:Uncharacterized protein n=1 Tax=Musa troglodytarum TaxID=320322 RepID=A0A9E7FG97_9LILI|nr:hypothetical protein MUK42_32538 [Musa troglodytarum]
MHANGGRACHWVLPSGLKQGQVPFLLTIPSDNMGTTDQASGCKNSNDNYKMTRFGDLSSWLLPLEGLHHLPGEVWIIPAEVPVGCCLEEPAIATPLQVKVNGDHPRPEIKVLLHYLQNLLVGDFAGAVSVDKDRKGFRNTDGVRDLDDAAACKSIGHDALSCLPGDVGTAAVDLGWILAGEGTATMGSPATVGVDNDLAAGKPSIAMRSANDESTRRIKVEDGLLIEILLGDDSLDYMLLQVSSNLVIGDGLIVLGGDEHGMHTNGDHGTVVIAVLDGDLGLAIGPQPWTSSIFADFGEASPKFCREDMAQGHQLRCLICCIAKHVTLIPSADLLGALGEMAMDTLGDVRGLLLNVDKHLAAIGIEAYIIGCEPNGTAGVADNLLVVDVALGGDLTKDHDHVGLGARLTGNLAIRVLLEAGIKNCIRDLITELVWVPLIDRFRGEKEGVLHYT